MAGYSRPLSPGEKGGIALGAGLLLLPPLTLLALAEDGRSTAFLLSPILHRILLFTLAQAVLSTLLAAFFGVLLARALARRDFPGRGALLRLLSLPIAMPTLIGLYGIVAIYGRQGPVADIVNGIGLVSGFSLYGWSGLLIGHVFFNLPLVLCLLLPAWRDLPAETWRLAAQFGFDWRAHWRLIEWPLIRDRLPAIAILVFQLCFASFVIPLILGGGPRATTLELAIYQSLRFDFDPDRAAALAALQIVCAALASLLLWRQRRSMPMMTGLGRPLRRWDQEGLIARALDGTLILAGALFIGAPILALILEGLRSWLGDYPWSLLPRAIGLSLALALASALLAAGGGYGLARGESALRRRHYQRLSGALRLAGEVGLFLSPMAQGAAILRLAAGRIDLAALAPFGIVAIAALLALPYTLGIWRSALGRIADQDRLQQSLGLLGWARWRVERPILAPALRRAIAIAAALALGDLAAIAIFGAPDFVTLPLLLYRQIAAYRLEAAGGTALILLILLYLLFRLIEPREVPYAGT